MKLQIFFLILFLAFKTAAQEIVETEISSNKVFDLSIVKVYPDSFPLVSVIFQAKDESGSPLWLLNKNEFDVYENGYLCNILRVKNISKDKNINIGLVFDHSGSMVDNPLQMPDTVDTYQNQYFYNELPDDYIMSITYAKNGVSHFIENSNEEGDSILFVAFSSVVDLVNPLTNDISSLKETVTSLTPGGGTAFYDALYLTIDSLNRKKSNAAIVCLTDGHDNESQHNYDDIMEFAKETMIPVYVIGLGDVNNYRLERLAKSTNGFYYHTNEPTKLTEIYINIKKQIRSIYQLDYISSDSLTTDKYRSLEFQFTNDTLEFQDGLSYHKLPSNVLKYLKEKEKKRMIQTAKTIGYSGVGLVLAIGFTSFMIRRKKKPKEEIKITSIHPNPFRDEINIDFSLPNDHSNYKLKIYNDTNDILKEIQLDHNSTRIQLFVPEFQTGIYFFQISDDISLSNIMKGIK